MKNSVVRFIFQAAAIVLLVVLLIWLNKWAIGSDFISNTAQRFGYPGIFLAAVISGFNLIVPIPIIGFFPFFVEIGLSPALLILTISAGMMIGDAFGYLVGKSGRDIVEVKSQKIIRRLEWIQEKYPKAPMIVLFVYASVVPLPNEVLVVPLAFLGYRLRWIILTVFFGNIIFNLMVAFGFLHLFVVL
jgi:membrane protein YqaA with SNARE-associated domain